MKTLSHPFLLVLILIAHGAMLALVLCSFGLTAEAVKLCCAVLTSDLVGWILLQFIQREACTVDSVLLLVLGMSTVYQSCFGGLAFAWKHFIFGIAAFLACQASYLLVRNPYRAEKYKPLWYLLFFLLCGAIFFLTGSRGIWIDLGFITLQPSEFVKPVFVLIAASSIRTQLHKAQILGIHFVPDNLMLLLCTAVIAALQWYCRDLGSLPTFLAVAGIALLMRFRYLREKISPRLMIFLGLCCAAAIIAAWKLAPAYVQERLHSDIWSDIDGNLRGMGALYRLYDRDPRALSARVASDRPPAQLLPLRAGCRRGGGIHGADDAQYLRLLQSDPVHRRDGSVHLAGRQLDARKRCSRRISQGGAGASADRRQCRRRCSA